MNLESTNRIISR